MDFMDENQAMDVYPSFLKRKRGTNITPKGIDFVKSYCKIKDKQMLKKLEDIPYFELENENITIKNVSGIVYIAHKSNWNSCGKGFSIILFRNTSLKVFSNNAQTIAITSFSFLLPELLVIWL